MMKKILSLILCLFTLLSLFPVFSSGEEETFESRKTPLMGWASWNAYRTDISEEVILSQARKLKELGLSELGYTFVNVDDGWQYGRGEDGYVAVNKEKFPSGMDELAKKIHALGLSAGIYTDAGASTCGWESDNQTLNDDVGLYGHDETDLRRYFIDWAYDFVKVDWCGGRQLGLSQKTRYTEIGNVVSAIEKELNKDKIYNVCCWAFPGEWVTEVADSWRTGGDITNTFESVIGQIDNIKSLTKYTTPGHVNDLDMMQIGNGMTYEEDKSHFSMWCMMSTPLMLGMDLNSITDETLSIIKNEELIALDQDPACIQASVKKNYGNVEAWVKDLGKSGSDTKAIALLNRDAKQLTVTVSFDELGFKSVNEIKDLWAHTNIAASNQFKVTIPAHGTVVLKVTGEADLSNEESDILIDDGSVVEGEMKVENKPKAINLTSLGSYDWVHYSDFPVRMKNGSHEIGLTYHGQFCIYDNAAAGYSWSNGEEQARASNVKTGLGAVGEDAYILVSTPCDMNERTLSVTVGSYSAKMKIEMIVGGKIIDTKSVNGASSVKQDRLVTLTYHSDIPTTAYLRVSVERDLGSSESVNVEGVALSINITKSGIGKIGTESYKGKLTVNVPTLLSDSDEKATLIVAPTDTDGSAVCVKTVQLASGAKTSSLSFDLPQNYAGNVEFFLWKNGLPLCKKASVSVNLALASDYSIGMMSAKSLLSKGAVLLDVRSPEEYEKGHLEGALNIDYLQVPEKAESIFKDKSTPIIVYCSAAKRSTQAVTSLLKLGYTAVYNLGSMKNFTSEPSIVFSNKTCEVLTAGEKVDVNFTADSYDSPEIYISAGENSTFENALPIDKFTVPECDAYYLTLKAYLAYDGVCYAETSKRFIYWSEKTVDTFATDLAWSKATVGWGSIHKDRSVDNNPLRLAYKTFSHGIGTHATSEIEMQIPKGVKKFLAVAGCDEEMSGNYTMLFAVYIDGVCVGQSSLIKCGQHFVFDIDIPKDAKTILLYAYEGTYGSSTCDHADWAVAGFMNDVKEF